MERLGLTQLLSRPVDQRRLGPFLIDESRKLGEGGFAPVYMADEVHADVVLRTVALKIFSLGEKGTTKVSSQPSTPGASRRAQIVEEARALCRVEHPNVVRFYALPTDDELGLIGLAMEHVAGTSLEERLKQGPLSVAEALDVAQSVASALASVHAAGLVHRDVKPANIIDAHGIYKLIDFGIAAADGVQTGAPKSVVASVLVGDFMVEATSTFIVEKSDGSGSAPIAGTMGYIDPVCLQTGAPASSSSDLYALGATIFQCLIGKLPAAAASTQPTVDAKTRGAVFQEVLCGHAAAPNVKEIRDDVPEALAELVDSMLAADPKDRPRSAEAAVHSFARIRAEMRGRTLALPPEEVGPFRGLARFEEKDEDVFFGRSADVAASLELLRSRGFVALVGSSGSGKSSLARAGVAPVMQRGGLGGWPPKWKQVVVTPGRDPFETWIASLRRLDENVSSNRLEDVVRAVEAHPERTGQGVLLVVDQLEELVTLSELASRDRAVELIVRLSERATPGVRVLGAGRRDLLDDLLALPHGFGRLFTRGMQLVTPLSDSVWEDVLAQSLSAYGYRFEDDALRKEVLEQLRGTITAMPLVQFALTQLWAQRDTSLKIIPRTGLQAIGGIDGALERHAEATYGDLIAAGLEDSSRRLLLALTTPQGTRSKRAKAELGKGVETTRVIAALTDARLVVEEPDGFTLAHEALLSQWRRMREWVEALRSDRQLAEQLEAAASSWQESRDDTLLFRKRRLTGAADVLRANLVEVSDDARAFVGASHAAERRSRIWIGAGLGAVVLLGVAGATSYVSAVNAEQKRADDALLETKRQKDAAVQSGTLAESREREATTAKNDAQAARQTAEGAKKTAEDLKAKFEGDLKALEEKVSTLRGKELEELQKEIASRRSAAPPPPPPPPPITPGMGSTVDTTPVF